MTIRIPDAPASGLDVIRRSVPQLFASAPAGSRIRALGATPASVEVAHPHRVFIGTIDDLLAGKLLANAREESWRYFLVRDGEPFAAAEVAQDSLSHVNEGPFVEGTASAMIAAEEIASSDENEFEMRLLRVPALYLVAVWLAGGAGVLVPASPVPQPLEANRTYSEEELTAALRPLAEQRAAISDTMA